MSTPLELALLSCLLLGLRHGFDYDHLAAITDITSVQRSWREGMGLGLLYALGHALTVAVLGIAAVSLHLPIPPKLDAVGERLVGVTLIALAIYVAATLWRSRHYLPAHSHGHLAARSRVALLISGARYAHWRVRHWFDPLRPRPEPFAFSYDRGSVFTVGIIHGLGAETPSQLGLFLLTAHLGGTQRGLLGLGCFLVGLLMMNTLMTASASGVFLGSAHRPRLQTAVTSLAAAYSFAVGVVFLFGLSERLPALTH